MTSRIVVGIDGSSQSAHALEWAIERAAMDGSDLDLVNAFMPPVVADVYGNHGSELTSPLEWLQEYSEELLVAAEARVHESEPSLRCIRRSVLGSAAQVLMSIAAGASSIVVGRRGFGAAKSAVLGSVSTRLTTAARCPVIVTGDEDPPRSGPIVVGVDGSDFGAAALKYALAEAALRKAPVRAVTAYFTPVLSIPLDGDFVSALRATAEAEAADITSKTLPYARDADTESVELEQVTAEGSAADVILDHAADAQLIVVGSHGKGFARRLLLGSVSRRVLYDAERPVAVVDLAEPSDDELGKR